MKFISYTSSTMYKSICVFMLFWWAGGAPADTATAGTPEGKPAAHPVLAQGALLIAGKNLLDPYFIRTVILITEYGNEGTVGLVLNRRTTLAATQVLPRLEGLVAGPGTIYVGGPVAVNHIRLLGQGNVVPEGARKIIDRIFMINTIEALKQLGPGHMHTDNVRVYMGHAGWAPGQLETELLRGDWFIWPASSEVIFSKHPENIWHELIYLATAKWI